MILQQSAKLLILWSEWAVEVNEELAVTGHRYIVLLAQGCFRCVSRRTGSFCVSEFIITLKAALNATVTPSWCE